MESDKRYALLVVSYLKDADAELQEIGEIVSTQGKFLRKKYLFTVEHTQPLSEEEAAAIMEQAPEPQQPTESEIPDDQVIAAVALKEYNEKLKKAAAEPAAGSTD